MQAYLLLFSLYRYLAIEPFSAADSVGKCAVTCDNNDSQEKFSISRAPLNWGYNSFPLSFMKARS